MQPVHETFDEADRLCDCRADLACKRREGFEGRDVAALGTGWRAWRMGAYGDPDSHWHREAVCRRIAHEARRTVAGAEWAAQIKVNVATVLIVLLIMASSQCRCAGSSSQ